MQRHQLRSELDENALSVVPPTISEPVKTVLMELIKEVRTLRDSHIELNERISLIAAEQRKCASGEGSAAFRDANSEMLHEDPKLPSKRKPFDVIEENHTVSTVPNSGEKKKKRRSNGFRREPELRGFRNAEAAVKAAERIVARREVANAPAFLQSQNRIQRPPTPPEYWVLDFPDTPTQSPPPQ